MRKRRVVGRIYGMKYTWKGHKDGDRHKNRLKTSGQARLVYVKNINRDIPTTWRWARGDPKGQKESKIHHHASREGSGNSRDSLSVGHIQLELRYHLLRGMAEEVTASTLHRQFGWLPRRRQTQSDDAGDKRLHIFWADQKRKIHLSVSDRQRGIYLIAKNTPIT